MIVLDASSVVEMLLRTEVGEPLLERLLAPRAASLHAPHLLDVEVAQVLRRFVGRGSLASGRAREALRDLADLPIERYSHEMLLPRIWSLRLNLTAYDAAYVARAELRGVPLPARDIRRLRAPGHAARIEAL